MKEELEEKERRMKLEWEEKVAAAEKAAAAEAQMIAAAEKAALKTLLEQQAAEAEAHRRRRQEQYNEFKQQRPSAERMSSAATRGRSLDAMTYRRGCVTIEEEPTVIESPRGGSARNRSGCSAPASERERERSGGLASKVAHAVGGVAVTGLVATVVTGMLARDAVLEIGAAFRG